MTEKRFTISIDSNDRKSLWDDERTEEEPLIALNRFGEIWGIDDCCKLLNSLSEENEQLKQLINDKTCDNVKMKRVLNATKKENEQLKRNNNELIEKIKKLEKEIHLIHMSSMFSTVKSFKGDVSKRYCYDEKTDKVYDTANHYGQYYKILGKKEITMLLNEYETVLNEGEQE